MTLSPVAVEDFGGLNLVDDPGTIGWNGAIDLLDVDLDRPGVIRERDHYSAFVANTTLTTPAIACWPWQGTIASDGATLRFYSGLGVLVSSTACASSYPNSNVQAIGVAGTDYLYLADDDLTATVRRLTTAGVLSSPAGMPKAKFLTHSPTDNRLIAAHVGTIPTGSSATASGSLVHFSDAGAPETWGANNWVDLDPGDGETIQGACSWRDLTFVFKQTKFFIFYGTSTDSSGNPIFNYRAYRNGLGTRDSGEGVPLAVAPDGVYFVGIGGGGQIGVFRTTGGEPERISRAIDPALNGVAPATFSGAEMQAFWFTTATYAAGRFTLSAGTSTTQPYLFHYNIDRRVWTVDYLGSTTTVAHLAPSNNLSTLQVAINGANAPIHQRVLNNTATDTLRTPTSVYRSGFSDLGTTNTKEIREWLLEGSGSPTFKVSDDFGSLDTGAAVTLGVAPAIAEGRRRYAARGRQFSWQVGGSTPWALNNLVARVREKRAPGTHS